MDLRSVRQILVLGSLAAIFSLLSACGKNQFQTSKNQSAGKTAASEITNIPESSAQSSAAVDWDQRVDIEFPKSLPQLDNEKNKNQAQGTQLNSVDLPASDEEDYTKIPTEFYIPTPIENKPDQKGPQPKPAAPAKPAPVIKDIPKPKTSAPTKSPSVKVEVPAETPSAPMEIKTPAVKDQAIRYVDNGRLQNPANLMERRQKYGDQSPFELAFPSRKRFFATDDLADFIETMGTYLQSMNSEAKLLISDIAKPAGGAIYSLDPKTGEAKKSHLSHQNGLDADIAYFPFGKPTQFFTLAGVNVGKTVDVNAQMNFFLQSVKTNMVDLVFVYPSLKKELCVMAYKKGLLEPGKEDPWTVETLKRIIPDSGHFSHFHLRLKCDTKIHPQCIERKDASLTSHGCLLK